LIETCYERSNGRNGSEIRNRESEVKHPAKRLTTMSIRHPFAYLTLNVLQKATSK
jgi:hypothetical protein